MALAETALEKKVNDIITPSIESLGYEVVRIRMSGDGKNRTLQIMIDRNDGNPIDVDDCASASYQISAVLDVEDPIDENYNLEVSSTGVDRPLTRLKDFERFKDLEVKIETIETINARRRFTGVLKGTNENNINLELKVVDINTEANSVQIDFDNVKNAKLVLNDELMAVNGNN